MQNVKTDKQYIIIGAGTAGQIALHYFGTENVFCFVDNNKHGQHLYGKDVISFDTLAKIHTNYTVVICVNFKVAEIFKQQCIQQGIPALLWDDVACIDNYPINENMVKFKNYHAGKRCFLIGNGPSLCPNDLNILAKNNEISFGCNKIYKVFDTTIWRPNYFVAADSALIFLHYQDFASLDVDVKFIQNPEQIFFDGNHNIKESFQRCNGSTYFYNKIVASSQDNIVPFSSNPSKALYITGTVMYPMLQIAAYMGFSEIYLLGVDGTIDTKNNHFYNDDIEDEKYRKLRAKVDPSDHEAVVTASYESARIYGENNNIKIFNATRGGNLKVFERIDFDTLF